MQTKKALSIALMGSCLLLGLNPLGHAQNCQDNASPTTPTQRFADQGNGTITDQATGLMWKICVEGQQGQSCYGKALLFSWVLAQQRAASVSHTKFAGYSDWRLPTLQELRTLVERQCVEPAINLQVFPHTPAAGLWSGTEAASNAWSVDFAKGQNFQSLKQGGKYLRLVRNLR